MREKRPRMVGYYANTEGIPFLEDYFMITLSRGRYYMEDYLQFGDDIGSKPVICKYAITIGKGKLFNPHSGLHQFILSTALPPHFEIDEELITKERFFEVLMSKNNAMYLEDKYIFEILFELGFAGMHSLDRKQKLVSIFSPALCLTLLKTDFL